MNTFQSQFQNYDKTRYVGYRDDYNLASCIFNPVTVKNVRDKCIEKLRGLDPQGRVIVPSDSVINQALNIVYEQYKRPVGDIQTHFLISKSPAEKMVTDITLMTVNYIVKQIRGLHETEQSMKNFDVWDTILGDFNKYGINPTPEIKINETRAGSDFCFFNMRY